MPSPASGSGAAYSRADRLLHRLALGSRAAVETSFDLEWAAFGRAAAKLDVRRPVFVCGLARAGTSLVARLIAAAPGMASPTYRDMPFPLAPNLWARFGGRSRRLPPSPRGHGDGMLHDLDTPEAVEEVFWRCFEPRPVPAALAPTLFDAQTMASFRRYLALVMLRRGGDRYVSKNNNNVVRVAVLAEAFPDALFVHPFRHPLAQARSLQAQHDRACALQRDDRFRRLYAGWLRHREFGLDRRPFLLPGAPAAADGDDARYWLSSWQSVYRHLLDQPERVRSRQFFLDYDRLCVDPETVLTALARFLDVVTLDYGEVRPPTSLPEGLPTEIETLYAYLRARSGDRVASPFPAPEPSLGMPA